MCALKYRCSSLVLSPRCTLKAELFSSYFIIFVVEKSITTYFQASMKKIRHYWRENVYRNVTRMLWVLGN